MSEARAITEANATHKRVVVGSHAYLYLLLPLVPCFLVPAGMRVNVLLLCNLAVLLLFAFDATRLWSAHVEVERKLELRLRVLVESSYELIVRSRANLPLLLRIRDDGPMSCTITPEEHTLSMAAAEEQRIPVRIFPNQRGHAQFGDVYVRRESGLRLCAIIEHLPSAADVRVLPEATLERKSERKGPRREVGEVAMRLRRATHGSELESLREYVPSDPLRTIDWKATAKRQRPVTRLYQPERSQTLWFVLDASRTMAASLGEAAQKTRFDVALEALLVAADGALRAGDQVGVIVQGDTLVRVIPPGRGRGHYRRLLDLLADVQAAPVQLDVRSLVAELERRARKRSLLVLFTDLENETHGEALYEHAQVLTRRHLVLCVSLDDSITRSLADAASEDGERAVYQRAAAIDMLRERTELTRRLEKRGVLVLEADESGLARATLDRYLEIKTRSLL